MEYLKKCYKCKKLNMRKSEFRRHCFNCRLKKRIKDHKRQMERGIKKTPLNEIMGKTKKNNKLLLSFD